MWMLGVTQHTETLHQRRVALEQQLKVVTHFITQMLCYVHKDFGRNKACMVKLVWSIQETNVQVVLKCGIQNKWVAGWWLSQSFIHSLC